MLGAVCCKVWCHCSRNNNNVVKIRLLWTGFCSFWTLPLGKEVFVLSHHWVYPKYTTKRSRWFRRDCKDLRNTDYTKNSIYATQNDWNSIFLISILKILGFKLQNQKNMFLGFYNLFRWLICWDTFYVSYSLSRFAQDCDYTTNISNRNVHPFRSRVVNTRGGRFTWRRWQIVLDRNVTLEVLVIYWTVPHAFY